MVEYICTRTVACMSLIHNNEKKSTSAAALLQLARQNSDTEAVNDTENPPTMRVPLSAVHAVYMMKEFYIPVYDAVSYDVDLLCIACKMHPVYKLCSRLAKKNFCKRFNLSVCSVLSNMSCVMLGIFIRSILS